MSTPRSWAAASRRSAWLMPSDGLLKRLLQPAYDAGVGGLVVTFVIYGLALGGIARWLVPGPDPMPLWASALVGLIGMGVGAAVGLAVGGTNPSGTEVAKSVVFLAIPASVVVVILYRRVVQKRPLTGPRAQTFPTRGLGVTKARRKLGLDAGTQPPTEGGQTASTLQKLKDLRDADLLTDEEYKAKRIQALEPDPDDSEWAPILKKVGLRRGRPEKSSD